MKSLLVVEEGGAVRRVMSANLASPEVRVVAVGWLGEGMQSPRERPDAI